MELYSAGLLYFSFTVIETRAYHSWDFQLVGAAFLSLF